MTETSAPTLLERYQDYRTRQYLKREQAYRTSLPGWRTRPRRRLLVGILVATFVFMFSVGVICAFGVGWAPLLWLPACVVFFPAWIALQIVSGRQGDAPTSTLDEWEIEQRNSARSAGLAITQGLGLIPIFYLIVGSVLTRGENENMAYAGGLMGLTVLIIGGCSPAMILGWTKPDPDAEDSDDSTV